MEMPDTRKRVIAAVIAFVVFGAAGAFAWWALGPSDDDGSGPRVTPDRAALYETNTTILESRDHGPELCLGGVAESYPPQCGGIPIANWDWSLVQGEEAASGTTWGSFHVVGRYDGSTFTVTDAGPYQQPSPDSGDPFAAPCPEPDGGWIAPDPTRATEEHRIVAAQVAEAQSDSAGIWIDYLVQPVGEAPVAPGDVILVAAFTGDLVRHEAELREVWGGPLCVTRHERSLAELERIQAEIASAVGERLGLEKTWSAVDVMENEVELGVVVVDADVRAALDARYGPGAVELHPALLRVQ
jgi:hypothetical protein